MASQDKDERHRPVLEAFAAEERARLGDPPELEEVLAFVEGELEGADHERVADAISAFPEVAELAASLAAFEAEPEGEGIPESTAWPGVRDRLEAEGWPGAGTAIERAPEPPSSRARESPTVPWWVALAAAVIAGLLGVWFTSSRMEEGQGANTVVATLFPAESPSGRGNGPDQRVELPDDAESLTLILAHDGADSGTRFRLSLLDETGRERWFTDRVRPQSTGELTATIPRELLAAGRYRLELWPRGAALDVAALATWKLRIETVPAPE